MKRQYDELANIARQAGIQPDWHEPDQQGVRGGVTGKKLDNAGVDGEFKVHLFWAVPNGESCMIINLARFLAEHCDLLRENRELHLRLSGF